MPSDISNKGENTQSFGTNDQLISDFSLTRNLEGDQTERGTITYTQKGTYEAVSSMIPILGSTSQYFKNGAVLQSYTISAEPSNAWKVVLTYYNPSSESAGYIDADGGSEKECTLSVTTESRSIMLHPKFFNGNGTSILVSPFSTYIDQLCKGGSASDMVYPPRKDGSSFVLDTSADKVPIQEAINMGVSMEAIQVASNLDSPANDEQLTYRAYLFASTGVVSYLTTHITWTETEYSQSMPTESKLGNVGQRKDPKHAPSFGNRNWLITDVNSSYDTASDIWRTTWTYTLSDDGGSWDKFIYNQAS